MPGIAGIIGDGPPESHERLVRAMIQSMAYDDRCVSGVCSAKSMGIHAGWVAHRGSYAAKQCRDTRGARWALVSGELFPTGEGDGRSGKIPAGPRLCQSLLLDRYDARGTGFAEDLNGLFSVLLVDEARKRALLLNDRYGIERIYVHERGDTLFFASEAKALLSILPELREWDDQGVAQFLKFGNTIDGRTLFRGIRFLQGGSLWRVEAGRLHRDRYFNPGAWESAQPLDEDTFERRFCEVFRERLPDYLVSERSLGISVTGGLDTRMIMACLPEGHAKAVCYTYAGREGETLDVRLGRKVAESCGLKHHVLRIGEDFLRGFGQYVDRTAYVTDGCAGPLHAHEIYFTHLAARLAPVRVTGNFGSEIFRSMSTFKGAELARHLLSPALTALVDSVKMPLAGHHPVTQPAFMEVPWHLFGTLAAARSELTVRTPYLDNDLVELAFKAPDEARRSPSAAFRLIHSMNERLADIPTDQGRTATGNGTLRELARQLYCRATFKLDYWHTEGIPTWLSPMVPLLDVLARLGLLGQHKYLPYRGWFRNELRTYMQDVLTDPRTRRSPFWNADGLTRVASDHASGRRNCLREIHAVLALDAVERTLLRQSATEPDLLPAAMAEH
jgi:asparagine synthase (glutamine-hydrolysing)